MASEVEPETKKPRKPIHVSLIILYFNHLFASSNLILHIGNFWLMIIFVSLEIPIEIVMPFISGNFRATVVQFSIKKIEFGDFKNSP